VALINQALAQRFFPHEDPIGARIDKDGGTTIVGIVGDVKNNGLSNPTLPELYNSYLQLSDDERIWAGNMYLLVRTERDAAALTPAIRAAIRKLDPLQNVNSVQTMRAILDASLAQPRFQGALLGAFAAAALLISMIGLYGVISYGVTERRHEIGVRMALGASRKQVVGLVLWNGMRIGGPGVVVGLAASLALTRVMRRFLFEVSPADPATFAATAALVAAAVLLAAYVPAWRATRVHPMIALRYE
jgi:putative ABC transport system permease protein